jgi:hypothetical protein
VATVATEPLSDSLAIPGGVWRGENTLKCELQTGEGGFATGSPEGGTTN